MSPAARDSDSGASDAAFSQKISKPQAESPDQQSDHSGPEQSEGEEEVYEIEAILDAKRGATGSSRIGYLVKWKGYPDEENSWVDEEDAIGAAELIDEFWARQGKKKSDKMGRKSDPKPKGATRRPVAISVETTPEPASATKKRGRNTRARPASDEDEENTRSKKRGRKSNGTTRKASPSPASPSDRDSPAVEFLEPTTIKKWRNLPSWENHIETINTVEKLNDNTLVIYFKLKGEKTPCKESSSVCGDKFPKKLLGFYETNLKWREEEAANESD